MSVKRWKLGWKRCDCVKCDHAITVEQTQEDCGWVMWGDHKDEVARLEAEVDRLRKAGDAMADAIYESDPEKLEAHKKFKLTDEEYNAVQLWNAAKEGKPSV